MARWDNALQTKDEIYRLKRNAVLRESSVIFSQKGFHNTSLAEVAERLNVSKGTLYNYVKDKQEILFEFHRSALEIGEQALEAGFAQEGSGAAKLAAAMRRYISGLIDELGGYCAIAEVGALKSEDRARVISGRSAFDKRFVELVDIGQRDGSLRPCNPKMMVFTFMGALQTIPNWYSPQGRLSGEEIASRVVHLLMNGMAKTEKPAARPTVRSGKGE